MCRIHWIVLDYQVYVFHDFIFIIDKTTFAYKQIDIMRNTRK